MFYYDINLYRKVSRPNTNSHILKVIKIDQWYKEHTLDAVNIAIYSVINTCDTHTKK